MESKRCKQFNEVTKYDLFLILKKIDSMVNLLNEERNCHYFTRIKESEVKYDNISLKKKKALPKKICSKTKRQKSHESIITSKIRCSKKLKFSIKFRNLNCDRLKTSGKVKAMVKKKIFTSVCQKEVDINMENANWKFRRKQLLKSYILLLLESIWKWITCLICIYLV